MADGFTEASGSAEPVPVAEFHVYCGRSNHPPLPEVSLAFQYEMLTVHERAPDCVAPPPAEEDRQEIDDWLSETLTIPAPPVPPVKVAPGNSRTVSTELVFAPDEAVCGVALVEVALTQAEPLTTVPLPVTLLMRTSGVDASSIKAGS